MSSAQDVPDGAAGFWFDGELMAYRENIVVNRRGIYGIWIGNTINQGPSQAQAYWWRQVTVYDRLPEWAPPQ